MESRIAAGLKTSRFLCAFCCMAQLQNSATAHSAKGIAMLVLVLGLIRTNGKRGNGSCI